MIIRNQQSEGGFALLLALIVASIVLSIGLSLLDVTVKQLSLGATARESEVAFQVAAAGMNCLQYVRNQQLSDTQAAAVANISFDCLGGNISLTDTGGASGGGFVRDFNQSGYDWLIDNGTSDPSDDERYCISLEMLVLNASALTSGQVTAVPSNGETKTCRAGDVCTFAFSRGHNRPCADLGGGSLVVQRELTAEF